MTSNLKIKIAGDRRRHPGLRLRHHRPAEVEATSWSTNWNKNIHLGLDLKGGSQLVLQVQMQDAFKAEADTVIERLKDRAGARRHRLTRDMTATIRQPSQDADTIADRRQGRPGHQGGRFPQPSSTTISAASGT